MPDMATPQITVRVDKTTKAKWQSAADLTNTNVSEAIRVLMDEWAQEVLAHEDTRV